MFIHMESTLFLLGIFFIVLGIIIKHGKLYNAIAGYNTLSEEERKKVAIDKLATLVRNSLVTMGVLMIAGDAAATFFEEEKIATLTFFLVIPLGTALLLALGNTDTYKKKPKP